MSGPDPRAPEDRGATGVPPRDSPPGGLEARRLVRDFGPQRAVDRISFHLPEGRSLALLGPNGAGKSTLLGLLAGSLAPSSGEVFWRGAPVESGDPEWSSRIGVLSHEGFLYSHLTARENLRLHGTLFGVSGVRERVDAALERVGLEAKAGALVRHFSRGMRQRLALARTLLHDPEVVFLDEPWTGLDPHAAELLADVLRDLHDGRRTVILVTHTLPQAVELSDEIAIQVGGRLVWHGDVAEVRGVGIEALYREVVSGGRAPS